MNNILYLWRRYEHTVARRAKFRFKILAVDKKISENLRAYFFTHTVCVIVISFEIVCLVYICTANVYISNMGES